MARGKYRQYNEPSTIKKRTRSEEQAKNPTEVRKRIDGQQMYDRVAAERYRHYVGETIVLNRFIEKNEREKTVGGVVVGLYPHFVLVDCGNYKASVTYADLVLGGKSYAIN